MRAFPGIPYTPLGGCIHRSVFKQHPYLTDSQLFLSGQGLSPKLKTRNSEHAEFCASLPGGPQVLSCMFSFQTDLFIVFHKPAPHPAGPSSGAGATIRGSRHTTRKPGKSTHMPPFPHCGPLEGRLCLLQVGTYEALKKCCCWIQQTDSSIKGSEWQSARTG